MRRFLPAWVGNCFNEKDLAYLDFRNNWPGFRCARMYYWQQKKLLPEAMNFKGINIRPTPI
jgi:hypothetical protein